MTLQSVSRDQKTMSATRVGASPLRIESQSVGNILSTHRIPRCFEEGRRRMLPTKAETLSVRAHKSKHLCESTSG